MNVFGPANPDWERRSAIIADRLRQLEPDVLALQEAPLDAERLSRLIDVERYRVTPFSRPSEDGVGGLIATLNPHRRIGEIDLRITERAREALPWTATALIELETPLGPTLIAHHKPSWPLPAEYERLEQARMLAIAVEEHVGERALHAIVLGDFDATPDSASMRFLRGLMPLGEMSVCYQDAWEYLHPADPGYTFDLANPLVRDGETSTAVSRRIDHILVRSGTHGPGLQAVDAFRILDRPVGSVWASDHFGVLVDLEVPANRPGFRSS